MLNTVTFIDLALMSNVMCKFVFQTEKVKLLHNMFDFIQLIHQEIY